MNFKRIAMWISPAAFIAAAIFSLDGCAPRDAFTEALEPTSTTTDLPSSTSTITQTPTIIPTSTVTPTATNTLTPQEADQWILDMLSSNGDCELPCLWGITPGETRLDHAIESLGPISDWFHFYKGNLSIRCIGNNGIICAEGRLVSFATVAHSDTDLNPTYFEDQEPAVIDYVNLRIFLQWRYDPVTPINLDLQSAAESYSLQNILLNYGIPSRILVQPLIGNEYSRSSFFADLLLFYEEKGFAIFYQGPLIYQQPDGSLIHCFSHPSLEGVEIIGHSPDDGMSIFEVLAEYTGHDRVEEEIQESRILDIEIATGVSVEGFYEIYSQPTTRCLVSDYDIWWGH